MLKKIGLASIILLANSTVTFAQTVPSPAQTAGAQAAGIEAPSAPVTTPTAGATGAAAESTYKPPCASYYVGIGASLLNVKGFTGLMPKLYAGYDTYLGRQSRYFWGVEIFAGTGSWRLSRNTKYRVSSVAGASVMPGFTWNEWTVIFARLGAEYAHFSKFNTTKLGGLVGVGFQTYEFGHWFMRVEWDYNFVRNFNQYNLDFLYKFA